MPYGVIRRFTSTKTWLFRSGNWCASRKCCIPCKYSFCKSYNNLENLITFTESVWDSLQKKKNSFPAQIPKQMTADIKSCFLKNESRGTGSGHVNPWTTVYRYYIFYKCGANREYVSRVYRDLNDFFDHCENGFISPLRCILMGVINIIRLIIQSHTDIENGDELKVRLKSGEKSIIKSCSWTPDNLEICGFPQ